MSFFPNIVFLFILAAAIVFFARNIRSLIKNIQLGKPAKPPDNKLQRWKNMALMALGQRKMVVRPVSGILHIFVYLGFIIINIEVLEIVIDGVFGTHRIFSFLGKTYDFLIGSFEILALLVIISVTVFWLRRNLLRLGRFVKPELKGWPRRDANFILYIETLLMLLFLVMNGADYQLQQIGAPHYLSAGAFPVSQWLSPLFQNFSEGTLVLVERSAWWLHIIGILVFLNYLYYSKHLHILLAFPNTWYAALTPKGQFSNLDSVTREVKLMVNPAANPYETEATGEPSTFGASDVTELTRVQLMNAYTCTECGRCTDECPANQTGKKLSPRKVMMDTRDRLEELSQNRKAHKGELAVDGKRLLDHYITREELWACTTCGACVEACPVGIDPLSIIIEMRRYLVMEQSAAPTELNVMMTNIENNGAPWPYNQLDRLNWGKE